MNRPFAEAEAHLQELLQVLKADQLSTSSSEGTSRRVAGSAYRFLRHDDDDDDDLDFEADLCRDVSEEFPAVAAPRPPVVPPVPLRQLADSKREGPHEERRGEDEAVGVAVEEMRPARSVTFDRATAAAPSASGADVPAREAGGSRFLGALELLLQFSSGRELRESKLQAIQKPLQDIASRLGELDAELREGEPDAEVDGRRRPDMVEVMDQTRRLLRQRNMELLKSDNERSDISAELRARDAALEEAKRRLQEAQQVNSDN